jgi:hypothetical protein
MPDIEDSIRNAANEARRFLRRIREREESDTPDDTGGQYVAAIKRASMDLSRALADVRKGNIV